MKESEWGLFNDLVRATRKTLGELRDEPKEVHDPYLLKYWEGYYDALQDLGEDLRGMAIGE